MQSDVTCPCISGSAVVLHLQRSFNLHARTEIDSQTLKISADILIPLVASCLESPRISLVFFSFIDTPSLSWYGSPVSLSECLTASV